MPTTLMELKGLPWNPGTPEFVNHAIIVEYIQSVAKKRDVEKDVLYDTRVEHVWKEEGRWLVRSTTLVETANGRVRKVRSIRVSDDFWSEMAQAYAKQEFDAVVVASGHYHAPKVPDIPGLKDWKQRWPTRVRHSKGYRDPEEYRNQVSISSIQLHMNARLTTPRMSCLSALAPPPPTSPANCTPLLRESTNHPAAAPLTSPQPSSPTTLAVSARFYPSTPFPRLLNSPCDPLKGRPFSAP